VRGELQARRLAATRWNGTNSLFGVRGPPHTRRLIHNHPRAGAGHVPLQQQVVPLRGHRLRDESHRGTCESPPAAASLPSPTRAHPHVIVGPRELTPPTPMVCVCHSFLRSWRCGPRKTRGLGSGCVGRRARVCVWPSLPLTSVPCLSPCSAACRMRLQGVGTSG